MKYTIITEWMTNNLNLSGNELLVFGTIYGFSQDGETKFKGGRTYLSKFLNISKSTIDRSLSKLVESGLLLKHEREVNNIKFNDYSANIPMILSKLQVEEGRIQNDDTSYQNDEQEIIREDTIPLRGIPAEPVLHHSRNFRTEYSPLEDKLGGLSDIQKKEEQKKKPKRTLFMKCKDEVSNSEYSFSKNVQTRLIDYLSFVLQGDEAKRIKGVGQWKGKLRALKGLSSSESTQLEIIDRSINEGWYGFFGLDYCTAERRNSPPQDTIFENRTREEKLADLASRTEEYI